LKVKFGSAWPGENKDNEIVAIPGLRGREPKEISVKNLASIIQARMEEIIEMAAYQIDNSGYADKLTAGIVLTGGGAMLRNLPQLMKFKTGQDVRLGYPKRYISTEGNTGLNLPKYSTSVGLILKGYDYLDAYKAEMESTETKKETHVTTDSKEKRGDGLISSLRETLSNLFDDKDSKM